MKTQWISIKESLPGDLYRVIFYSSKLNVMQGGFISFEGRETRLHLDSEDKPKVLSETFFDFWTKFPGQPLGDAHPLKNFHYCKGVAEYCNDCVMDEKTDGKLMFSVHFHCDKEKCDEQKYCDCTDVREEIKIEVNYCPICGFNPKQLADAKDAANSH